MHSGFIHISLGHLPFRTEESHAGSTQQRCLQDETMSGVHKVTVQLHGQTPAGRMLVLTIGVRVKRAKRMAFSEGMKLCRCERTVVLLMVGCECTSCSGDWDLWCAK